MAEGQDTKCLEDISQESPPSKSRSRKPLVQTFSILRGKSKRKEKEDLEREDTSAGPSTKPPDLPGKMTVKTPSTEGRVTSTSKSKLIQFLKKNIKLKNKDNQSAEIPQTFKQNLKEQHFAVAEQQLIHREEHLFSMTQDEVEFSKSPEQESLKKDFEDLMEEVWTTVENSFKVQTEKERVALKQAVLVIQQEEERDRRWEGVAEKECPPWRPRCCRRTHDTRLQNMVMRRMEEAKLDSNTDIKSSIQKEITGKGKQLQEDLLYIAKHVMNCYPEENVCQLYAELYHQAFGATLREIADFGLTDDDSLQVLQWVNIHYPSILRLIGFIEYGQLEALLPQSMLEPLEDQFLAQNESELQTWWQNILKEEKPDAELRDGCYFSHLAIDVIECFHGAIKSAEKVLNSCTKPQRITHQLKEFLIIYQDYLKNVTKDNKGNTDAILKANLPCIRQLREYITKNQELFLAHIRTDCMNLLFNMREHCNDFFTKSVHEHLKRTYAKLGTREWLRHSGDVCEELREAVDTHIQRLSNLDTTCQQDLVSQLHKEVLAEYVMTMMKKKKFADEKEYQQAAKALQDNSQRIHTLFTTAGSKMDDLKNVLPRLAELLTLKDPQFIELELVNLSKSYPDFSEAHVQAWLQLNSNLSTSKLREIKKTFSEFQEPSTPKETDDQDQDPLYSSSNFFSRVLVK